MMPPISMKHPFRLVSVLLSRANVTYEVVDGRRQEMWGVVVHCSVTAAGHVSFLRANGSWSLVNKVLKLELGNQQNRQAEAWEPAKGDRGRDGSSPPLPPNRTGGFPASGSPVGGFTSTLRTEAKLDEPPQG